MVWYLVFCVTELGDGNPIERGVREVSYYQKEAEERVREEQYLCSKYLGLRFQSKRIIMATLILLLQAAFVLSLVLHSVIPALGAQDGLARTPPMGWRSWNEYGKEILESDMRDTAAAVAAKRDVSTGLPISLWNRALDYVGMCGQVCETSVSLLDLGYNDVGLDDNWQACGQGVGNSFHDKDGNPLLNKERFPDMKGMVDYIHSLGLKAGWYHNNCICQEKNADLWPAQGGQKKGYPHYQGDVNATVHFGYDSVKLDGCGAFLDLDLYYELYSPNNIMIENCHWGVDTPTLTHCPYHMFRTSGDILATFKSMVSNLNSTRKYQDPKHPIARPGCWAYPDMLEVGRLASFEQDRTHFGAWAITSSPLILGHRVVDDQINGKIWPIIANKAAIAVNQQWAGHPGLLAKEVAGLQAWVKPLPRGSFGIFLINTGNKGSPVTLQADLVADFGTKPKQRYVAFDIWDKLKDVTQRFVSNDTKFKATVKQYDSVFLRLDVVNDDEGRVPRKNDAWDMAEI